MNPRPLSLKRLIVVYGRICIFLVMYSFPAFGDDFAVSSDDRTMPDRESMIYEVQRLLELDAHQTWLKNNQTRTINILKQNYKQYSSEETALSTDLAKSHSTESALVGISYTMLGISILTALPGPIIELARNCKTYGSSNKQVLPSALLWPVASSVGNILYLIHLGLNQSEKALSKGINSIPAGGIMIGSLITLFNLIYYMRKARIPSL